MSKYTLTIIIALITILSCNKPSKNIEVATQLEGKWIAISLKVDEEETVIPNVSKFVSEFYDFEENRGLYNLKVYGFGNLVAETEGSAEVKNNGKELILIEKGTTKIETSTIVTLSDDLLKISGVNDNGEVIVFVGEKD